MGPKQKFLHKVYIAYQGFGENNAKRCLIVAAAFLTTFLNIGLLLSIGALFVPISERFNTSRSTTAFVQSIMFGTGTLSVLAAALIEKIGLWKITLVGTVCATLGYAGGYFATDIIHLYISIGAIAGAGGTILFMCGSVSIKAVTEGRTKSAALAINFSCIGMGALVYPVLLNYLSNEYGLYGTYLIISGMLCNSIVLVILVSDVSLSSTDSTAYNDTITNACSANSSKDKTLFRIIYNLKTKCIRHFKTNIMPIFSIPYALTLFASVAVMSSLDGYLVLYVDIYKWKTFSEDQGISSMIPYQVGSILAGLLAALLKQFEKVKSLALSHSRSSLCTRLLDALELLLSTFLGLCHLRTQDQ